MARDNILNLHAWFSYLASGNFEEKDFDFVLPTKNKGEEAGRSAMGSMRPERRELIISDAKRHLAALEEKFPFLKDTPKEEEKPKAKPKVKKDDERNSD